jgi:putative spermidine/putrescine transport system ATP-binding protein
MAFLELTNISKTFPGGQAQAVGDFNLQVEHGEFVSFLGPSGCGKTTTLRMIAGFERPTSGMIRINGADVTHKPPNQRNVGMVFQSYALFPNLTVAGNIGFGLMVAKKPAGEIKARVGEMLSTIHLAGYGNRYPWQLSGGQQQRVALARALAIRPQVLLLDEPLSALDAKIRLSLRAEIRQIQQSLGITTVYVTHDQEEALSLSDRVVVMSAGHIEQVGTPFEIYNFPKTAFTASFVGTLNSLACTVADPAAGRLSLNGHTIQSTNPINQPAGAEVKLSLRPEELHFGAQDGQNQLTGEVRTVTFLGSIVRVQVAVGEAMLSLDVFNLRTQALPQVGEKITVSFPPDACWVL